MSVTRICPRCDTQYLITVDDFDPCPEGCKPVHNGGDLHYFKFHWNGPIFAWHPEEKKTVHVGSGGKLIYDKIGDGEFDAIMKTAHKIPYSKVSTAFRNVVHEAWGVAVKRKTVRAI